jgi:hypothetical protein
VRIENPGVRYSCSYPTTFMPAYERTTNSGKLILPNVL